MELIERAREIHRQTGKTVLIIDPLDDCLVWRDNSSFVVLDGRKMTLELRSRKEPEWHILEFARQKLVHAMKYGKSFVVRLSDSTTDFLKTFNDECCPGLERSGEFYAPNSSQFGHKSFLPLEFLFQGGDVIRLPYWTERLFRREDKYPDTYSPAICHPDFQVIVTSNLPMEKLTSVAFNGNFGLPNLENFEILTFPSPSL